MQTADGNNENIPTSPSRLSPLQIPKHEILSPQSPSPQVPIQGSQNSMHASHSTTPTAITTVMSHSMSSPSKNLLCGPPSPARLSSSSSTRIPWSESPSLMPPLCHQSSMVPYYPPMGLPPPFLYFSMPYPHDQFHSFPYPMIPGNNNNASNGEIFTQPWSTGLFDCFSDLKNCFITCLCPCVTFGQVDEILSEGQMSWWEGALMFGLLEMLCFSQVSFIFAWYHRVQYRKKYNLIGNLLSEFAITLCCMRLVLCQNYRQLNKLGFDVALGWKANKMKQRIASQAAVQFVPPMANPGMFR